MPGRCSMTVPPNAPLRLTRAAELAFPDGGMTVAGLRREAARGRLTTERIAGKDFTTLAAIEEMRERCRREARGARLWLKPAYKGEKSVWIIRDGGKCHSTGCGPRDREEAERQLADYLAAKYQPSQERSRDPAEILIADVLMLYAEAKSETVRRPAESSASASRRCFPSSATSASSRSTAALAAPTPRLRLGRDGAARARGFARRDQPPPQGGPLRRDRRGLAPRRSRKAASAG